MDKIFKLDFNHAPDLYCQDPLQSVRLRSGDGFSIGLIRELESFFAHEFGYKKSGFFDFSPLSIAKLIQKSTKSAKKLAVSSKLSHFCHEAVLLLQTFGTQIIWVGADKDGLLAQESLFESKQNGAEFLICAFVDEDTFVIEDLERINQYYSREKIILDISNSVKKIETPKVNLAFFWGYKLGSFKQAAVYLCDSIELEMLELIDISVFCHLKESYQAYSYNASYMRNIKELFISSVAGSVEEGFSTFVNTSCTLDNSVYCRFSGILARDFIRTLALDGIYTTNGELCSLGLSKPSRILQSLGFDERECREGLSVSFDDKISIDELHFVTHQIALRYNQISAILQD